MKLDQTESLNMKNVAPDKKSKNFGIEREELRVKNISNIIEQLEKENNGQWTDTMIPEKYSKKYVGYFAIQGNLLFCSNILTKLYERPNLEVLEIECLHISFLTNYASCFLSTDKNIPKLEDSIFPDKGYLNIHKQIMEIRSDRAHINTSPFEVYLAYIRSYKSGISHMKIEHRIMEIPRATLECYWYVTQFLLSKIGEKIKKVEDRLFSFINENWGDKEFDEYWLAGDKLKRASKSFK
ncbi:MAG: hypothetical protein ACPGLV_00475 [Bacteroidia bacterium]